MTCSERRGRPPPRRAARRGCGGWGRGPPPPRARRRAALDARARAPALAEAGEGRACRVGDAPELLEPAAVGGLAEVAGGGGEQLAGRVHPLLDRVAVVALELHHEEARDPGIRLPHEAEEGGVEVFDRGGIQREQPGRHVAQPAGGAERRPAPPPSPPPVRRSPPAPTTGPSRSPEASQASRA